MRHHGRTLAGVCGERGRRKTEHIRKAALKAPAKIERKTENLVRKAFQASGYEDAGSKIRIEEQKSEIEAVVRSMAAASKTGGGGAGAPEFIVSCEDQPDILVIVECKADTNDHASPAVSQIVKGVPPTEDAAAYKKRVQRYAADGALHYARFLARDFNVVALAVSGQTAAGMTVSTFIHAKGAKHARLLTSPEGADLDRIIPWKDCVRAATFDPAVRLLRYHELMAFSRELHNFMREHGKLTEEQKPLLVSGTLIALRNEPFAKSFGLNKPSALQKAWFDTIEAEFKAAEIPRAKLTSMVQPYSGLMVHPELSKPTKAYPKGALNEIVRMLNEKVWPFFGVFKEFDIVGQFYGEFLKYAGGDGKALGIVLTPRHVTELFAMLANVTKDSKVLDICAGTGGFLISAMHQMSRTALTEIDAKRIREHGLVGVEQQPHMFALAASNMILRGDGKANLYQGSCFDPKIAEAVKGHGCDVGMLNPPYSQKDTDLHELVFIKQMLDCLRHGGTGIAIVQMSSALAKHSMKEELLKSHTLEAVMSMPNEIFYPVGVVPCIMVFTAHQPHATSNRKTWFGYWKDDGFIKRKPLGRVDLNNTWAGIRDRWVDAYRNREVRPGECVMKPVGASDEWCAEAYMETDYSVLTAVVFAREVKRFLLFGLMNEAAEKDGLVATNGSASDASASEEDNE